MPHDYSEVKVKPEKISKKPTGKTMIYIYESLENQKVSTVSGFENTSAVLEIRAVNKQIFDDREWCCFGEYTLSDGAIFLEDCLESESWGAPRIRQLYILGDQGTLFNIDLLNDDIGEELSAIQEML